MKHLLTFLAIIVLACPAAFSEGALDYAQYLESYCPGETFSDVETPAFYSEVLGADYELTARESENGAVYIAAERKPDAPELSKEANVNAWQTFGEGVSTHWKLIDGGKTIYNLSQDANAVISWFDDYEHFIIVPDEQDYSDLRALFEAATPEGRALIEYRRENGFVYDSKDTAQLSVLVHDYDSWSSGATYFPTGFYENAKFDLYPAEEALMSIEDTYDNGILLFPTSVYYHDGENSFEMVRLNDGRNAYLFDGSIYAATADSEQLLGTVRSKLGYEPGELDYAGKNTVLATLEWNGKSKTVSDEKSMSKIYELTNPADDKIILSAGCPFDAFLTIEYDDGTKASIAVATDSCSVFFYHGTFFEYPEQSDLLDLFK